MFDLAAKSFEEVPTFSQPIPPLCRGFPPVSSANAAPCGNAMESFLEERNRSLMCELCHSL